MRVHQPYLHEQTVLIAAPAQCLSARDGSMGTAAVQGLFHSDTRVLRTHQLHLNNSELEALSGECTGSASASFIATARGLDPTGNDPHTTLTSNRQIASQDLCGTLQEELTLETAWRQDISTTLALTLSADLSALEIVKSGRRETDLPWSLSADCSSATLSRGPVTATVTAPGATLTLGDGETTGSQLTLSWDLTATHNRPATVSWRMEATDSSAVVVSASLPAPQRATVTDPRAARWCATAFDDVNHLLLARRETPQQAFTAAGAPWFFTLFGRDSLWAARLLLADGDPWSLALAEGTLRTLADLQGTQTDPDSAQQPGKIMHELRRGAFDYDYLRLPPLYYGTVDATPLWILTLADAWKAGLSDDVVRELLPALRGALHWLRDEADPDGDGFLEYIDETGHGLSNQGWKDSWDSVQFRDGSLAEGPIALVEVQAYAYAAALAGAEILEVLGTADDVAQAPAWREWAKAMKARFTDAFWVGDLATGYLAIALDAHKQRVDSVSSNLGHVLGTGILDAEHTRRVAEILVSEEMSSGYGLRTLSAKSGGYWHLSYHGGSVWTHDTAIAIDGLLREGYRAQARVLAEGLLAAAPHFGQRMPELYSGRSASAGQPVPYPASCVPQAWAAAASAVVARAVL